MQPKIVSKPAFSVIGLLHRGKPGPSQAVPQLWNRFGPLMQTIPHVVHPEVCYGMMGNYDEKTGEFEYVAACEVEPGTVAPEGMVRWDVPARTYAVFTTTLPQIHAAFDEIFQRWLPASGYHHAMSAEFELYGPTFDSAKPNSPLDIYIPIIKE